MLETSISLIERVTRDGKNDDWERLLTIYRPFIDQQIRKFPQLASQADDIAQDIAVVLTKELPNFKRQRTGSFRAWLKQVTIHQLLSSNRKYSKLPASGLQAQIAELEDANSAASQHWNKEHDRAVLKKVIDIVSSGVNAIHWQAFKAHVLDGEEVSVVAERLQVSENVVRLAKSRILRLAQAEAAGLLD